MQHPLYTAALSAYNNLSHDPERRAASWCAGHEASAAKVASMGGDVAKLDKLARIYLASLSRTASAMITGPARFPTDRNRKRQEWAEKHLERYLWHIEATERRHKRASLPPELAPAERLAELRQGLADMQAHYKAGGELRSFCGNFSSARLKDKIKRIEANIAAANRAQAQANAGPTPYQANAERVWFTFEGKPNEATRTLLKANGFKWTPSKGHWGRKLTPNALAVASRIAAHLTN